MFDNDKNELTEHLVTINRVAKVKVVEDLVCCNNDSW